MWVLERGSWGGGCDMVRVVVCYSAGEGGSDGHGDGEGDDVADDGLWWMCG
jgi:hypothetical protein